MVPLQILGHLLISVKSHTGPFDWHVCIPLQCICWRNLRVFFSFWRICHLLHFVVGIPVVSWENSCITPSLVHGVCKLALWSRLEAWSDDGGSFSGKNSSSSCISVRRRRMPSGLSCAVETFSDFRSCLQGRPLKVPHELFISAFSSQCRSLPRADTSSVSAEY